MSKYSVQQVSCRYLSNLSGSDSSGAFKSLVELALNVTTLYSQIKIILVDRLSCVH